MAYLFLAYGSVCTHDRPPQCFPARIAYKRRRAVLFEVQNGSFRLIAAIQERKANDNV